MVGQSLSWRVIPRHLIPQVIQRCWLSSINRIVFRMSHLIAIVSEEIKVFPSAINESFRLIVKKVSVTHVQHALVMQDTCAGVLPNTHFHLGYECGKINLCIYIWVALFTSDLSADSLAFAEDQASSGSIACLNIWSQDFSPETMMSVSLCKNSGDVFHLNTESGLAHGSVEVTDVPIGGSGSHYVTSLKEFRPWQYLYSIKILIAAW